LLHFCLFRPHLTIHVWINWSSDKFRACPIGCKEPAIQNMPIKGWSFGVAPPQIVDTLPSPALRVRRFRVSMSSLAFARNAGFSSVQSSKQKDHQRDDHAQKHGINITALGGFSSIIFESSTSADQADPQRWNSNGLTEHPHRLYHLPPG